MTEYYLGKIKKVVNRVTYEILVDIDGIVEDKPAYPASRGEMDEPKVGDNVMLRNIDPLYGSMYLYEKLKEDEFVGFRSNGKAIDVTPNYIEMRVYKFNESNDSQSAHDDSENYISRVRIEKNGDIRITTAKGNVFIDIDGDVNQTITGNVTEVIEGNLSSEVNGRTTLTGPDITVKGPGTLKVNAQAVIPKAEGGPFCTFKVAPPPGTPMVSGDTIILKG